MGKAKTEKSAARNTDAATSAMRTGTTTQQEKPQNQVKGAKFKTTKISPNSMGTNVSRVINDEAMLLEKISSIPTMCTLFAIFAGPIGFFGLQGSSELGTCAEKNDACMSSCMADWTESVAGLRGANKFAVQQAADGTLAVCESRCQEVKSQCDFEAMLKILACLGLAGIVLCVALRANVNYFVDQNIAAMEQTIAEEAAEMTRKAKKEEQKGSGAASPGRKKGTKANRDEDAGADIEVRSHHSGGSGSRGGGEGAGGTSAPSDSKAYSSTGRSEESSALSANVIKGSQLEDMLHSKTVGRNPYIVKKFTGSRDQKTKCPYCLLEFYQLVSYDLLQGTLSSSPVVCLGCGEVISGFI